MKLGTLSVPRGGSRLAIFSVSQFWYMFEFEICEKGYPLGSERGVKDGHN